MSCADLLLNLHFTGSCSRNIGGGEKMSSEEKEFLEITEEKIESEYVVNDITKVDHWLMFGIGIFPFLIATIWYVIGY